MNISVIIVSWNAKSFLQDCLESLTEQADPQSTEIIVVDNASSDGSPEMVAAKFPGVILIQTGKNLGFAKANNIGIHKSSGRYIALVNSDIKVLGNCLSELGDYLDQHPDVGVVGPKILNSDLTLQISCRQFPTLWNNFCEASGLAKAFSGSRLFSGEQMFYFCHDQVRDVDVLVGCFWLVRRIAFEAAGRLDEGYFIYAEDVDWCKRCWEVGWRVVFFPGPQAIHYRGGSSANDPERFALEQQRAILRYWSKHHGPMGHAGIRSLLFLRYMARSILGTICGLLKPATARKYRDRVRVNTACMAALIPLHAKRNAFPKTED